MILTWKQKISLFLFFNFVIFNLTKLFSRTYIYFITYSLGHLGWEWFPTVLSELIIQFPPTSSIDLKIIFIVNSLLNPGIDVRLPPLCLCKYVIGIECRHFVIDSKMKIVERRGCWDSDSVVWPTRGVLVHIFSSMCVLIVCFLILVWEHSWKI